MTAQTGLALWSLDRIRGGDVGLQPCSLFSVFSDEERESHQTP